MSDRERRLRHVIRAHAPAATSHAIDALDASLELHADFGFDLIALAELAVALEDAFGIGIDLDDLDRCRTLGDLNALLAARGA